MFCKQMQRFLGQLKIFKSDQKVSCVGTQYFCIFSQKYYVPTRNFADTCKTFTFFHKSTAFPQGGLRLLVTNVLWRNAKFLGGTQYFKERTQIFCDFWGNAKFLRMIGKFLCWNAILLWTNKNVFWAKATFHGGTQKFCYQTRVFSRIN